MNKELVLVIDFGGQYSQLIARRIREFKVYCEILPYTTKLEDILAKSPQGVVFSGGPNSVYEENSPKIDKRMFEQNIPILGICYGCQLIAFLLEGKISSSDVREYGKTNISLETSNNLFINLKENNHCWMSHTDYVSQVPKDFKTIAKTPKCLIVAIANEKKKIYGVQFHPEVMHTPFGNEMIANFLFKICLLKGNWTISSFIEKEITYIKNLVGDKKVICALSGGVDSSVAAVLINKAIGNQLTCVFVDHGLLRKDEGDQVENYFKNDFQINFIRINAKDRFLNKLKNVSNPEEKRKIIGREFIEVFQEYAQNLGEIDFLVQGTIYPDIVESGTATSDKIKTHHNVGGLPKDMKFKLIEPLRDLFKDEVRKVGKELGIPSNLVHRQPFPGPGLAIRILGEISEEKLHIVREADAIFREEIALAGLERDIWQYFACLPNIASVGVMGDKRTYCHTVALRAVVSSDAMTSDWAKIPYEVLDNISRRIVNEVKDVNRVVYDITSKPPATIEWE